MKNNLFRREALLGCGSRQDSPTHTTWTSPSGTQTILHPPQYFFKKLIKEFNNEYINFDSKTTIKNNVIRNYPKIRYYMQTVCGGWGGGGRVLTRFGNQIQNCLLWVLSFYGVILSQSLNCWWVFHSVLFNLAVQYENNEMYTEALNTYQVSEKNLTKEPSK
jgi:hypothetical protein